MKENSDQERRKLLNLRIAISELLKKKSVKESYELLFKVRNNPNEDELR